MVATTALPHLSDLGSLCRSDADPLCIGEDSVTCRWYGHPSDTCTSHSDNLCGCPCPCLPWFRLAPDRTCMDRLWHPRFCRGQVAVRRLTLWSSGVYCYLYLPLCRDTDISASTCTVQSTS